MKALVTGTSGHVGGAIAAHLAAVGWQVFGLSRRPPRIEGLSGHLEFDLALPGMVKAVCDAIPPCDAIVHAAASLQKSNVSPEIPLVNCFGTQQMISLAREWETPRFVFISGVSVIGWPIELPITEQHPTHPTSAYLASKLFGEHLVSLSGNQIPAAVTLRLPSPVGPGTPSMRIMPVFVRRALAGDRIDVLGRGSRRQDYLDVRDAARAVEICLNRGAAGLFNIATGRSVANLELARTCVRVLGSASQVELSGNDPDDETHWDISTEKAASQIGFTARHSLDDSIQALATEIKRSM